MMSTKFIHGFAFLLVSSILLPSCSTTLNPNRFGRKDTSKKPRPELSVSALGMFDKKNKPGVDVDIKIDSKTLIYSIQKKNLVARANIKLKLINEKQQKVTLSKNYNLRIRQELTADLETLGIHKLHKKIAVTPGRYTVVVSATDKRTGLSGQSKTTVSVPNPNKSKPTLTDIQLYGYRLGDKEYKAISSYDLRATYDTLRLVAQVAIPNTLEKPMQMRSRLIRFASDTLPSRPMGSPNYTESSIQYKGVNYYKEDVLQTIDRTLPETGNVTVEFKYPALERGNYRFDVRLEKSSPGGEQESYRDFGIRSEHFPLLSSAREKAKPLTYLMKNGKYEQLLSIKNSDSLIKAIDRFWYSHISDTSKAEAVKRQYYHRVLIANKEFTNYKEGWKTDQGMIFILFGNPWVIDKDFGKETWFYSYNRLDQEKTFTFFRTKVQNDAYPFKNYLLQRKFDYNNVLYQQKRLWLSGLILDTQI